MWEGLEGGSEGSETAPALWPAPHGGPEPDGTSYELLAATRAGLQGPSWDRPQMAAARLPSSGATEPLLGTPGSALANLSGCAECSVPNTGAHPSLSHSLGKETAPSGSWGDAARGQGPGGSGDHPRRGLPCGADGKRPWGQGRRAKCGPRRGR